MRERAEGTVWREAAWRCGLPLAVILFHGLFAAGYGVFRDELYYIACGRHLDWGYVDHPPVVALVAALSERLFGPSWIALRWISALAAGLTVLFVGETARLLGGGRFARGLAQLLAALAPVFVALAATYSMNPLDLLLWAGLFALAARLLAGGDPRLWLAFGALAGLALQTKLSGLYVGAGLVAGLLVARRWDLFGRRWLWVGGGVAALLLAPHLLWQVAHGWPTLEFVENARRIKIQAMAPHEFVLAQFLQAGPAGFALALGGVAWLLAARPARPWRALGWGALATLAILAFGRSKPYYFAPVFALLFPAAAVAVEGWSGAAAPRVRGLVRAAAVALVALQALLLPFAKPLLPVESYLRYAAALGVEAGSSENQRLGRLPQYFADMHGWEELARSVARVVAELPEVDRARACVFAQNYGEAGAIDLFGPGLGLPPAISGHNSYWLWGPGACTGEVVIVLGGDRAENEASFESLEFGGVHRCTDCMPYEDELAIWIGRNLRAEIGDAWGRTRRYI